MLISYYNFIYLGFYYIIQRLANPEIQLISHLAPVRMDYTKIINVIVSVNSLPVFNLHMT